MCTWVTRPCSKEKSKGRFQGIRREQHRQDFWGWFHTGTSTLSGEQESSSPSCCTCVGGALVARPSSGKPPREEACLGTRWFLTISLMLSPNSNILCSFILCGVCCLFLKSRNHLSVWHRPSYSKGSQDHMIIKKEAHEEAWAAAWMLGGAQCALRDHCSFHTVPWWPEWLWVCTARRTSPPQLQAGGWEWAFFIVLYYVGFFEIESHSIAQAGLCLPTLSPLTWALGVQGCVTVSDFQLITF